MKCGGIFYPFINTRIVFRCGYNGEKLETYITSIKIVDGCITDLKINKSVFDIEFELIKEGKNGK